jgi:hypothetical protein
MENRPILPRHRRAWPLALRAPALLALWAAAFPAACLGQLTEIQLGDLAAGGDGTGTSQPDIIGIHPDTAVLQTAHTNAPIFINDGSGLQPVDDAISPFIDSVFIVNKAEMTINTSGATFTFPAEDLLSPPETWDAILKDRIGGEDAPVALAGVTFEHGVGIHAAAGITFDLDALRQTYGAEAVGEVTAMAGMGDSPSCLGNPGMVTTYLILSDDSDILDFASHRSSVGGVWLSLPIPEGARFLTLASGAGNGQFYCNAGTFGGAAITPVRPITVTRRIPDSLVNGTSATVSLTVTPNLGPGQVEIEEELPAGLTASSPSNGGTIDGNGVIHWSLPGLAAEVVLAYTAAAAESAADGEIAGKATFDGKQVPIFGESRYTGSPFTSLGFIKLWSHLGPLAWHSPAQAGDHGPGGACDAIMTLNDGSTVSQLPLDWIVNQDGSLTEATMLPFPGMLVRPAYGGDGVVPGGSGARAAGLVIEPGDTGSVVRDRFPVWRAGLTRADTINHWNPEVTGFDAEDHLTMSCLYLTNHTGAAIDTFAGFSSDDSIQILLNDVDILKVPLGTEGGLSICRAFGGPNEEENTVPVTIPPGENRLLVKVTDGFGVSGFRLRFQDPSGDPSLPGLLPPALTVSLESARNPSPGSAARSFEKESYGLEEEVQVSLLTKLNAASDLLLREALPEGSVAGAISDGGVLSGGAIEWRLKGVAEKTVSYRLTGTACAADLVYPPGTSFLKVLTNEVAVVGASRLSRSYREDDLGSWESRDLGSSGGSAERLGDHQLLVKGTGLGIKLQQDSFRFTSSSAAGDFELTARIDCMDDPGKTGVAGLMVRDTADPGAANAFLALSSIVPAAGGVGTLKGTLRAASGKSTSPLLPSSAQKEVPSLPLYLRIKRAGGTLSFQRSPDGSSFVDLATKEIGTAAGQIALGAGTLTGLAVSAGGGGETRARFAEVSGPPFAVTAPEPRFRRGDVDGNGVVEITDPVKLLGYLFLGSGSPECLEAGDTDNNGSIDITDAVTSLGYQFLGQTAPAAPGPTSCGPDPAAPFLGCDRTCP